MKFLFTVSLLVGWLAAAAQTPTTPPSSTTTGTKPAPPAKVLTPAEIRQKERVAKILEEERKIRDNVARSQREYQAKQAEKDRQRREKDLKRQEKVEAPTPAVTSQAEQTSEPPKRSRPERVARTPKPAPAAPAPTVSPDSAAAATDSTATGLPAEAKSRRTTEPAVSNAATERDAQRRQEQAQRERQRQQQQAERDARKVERAKTRVETSTEIPTSTAILAPEATGVPGKEFLPKGHLFAPILLDPLEAQTYVSVLPAFRTDGRNYPGSIVPFEFGFCKPFFRWTKFKGRASELSLDVASYTQFEVYHDDVRNTQKRQLINTDYKFSVIYNLLRNDHVWRFRFYHISSHLGDDFLFRNSIQAYTPNSVNYELLDVTYSQTINNTRFYAGAGAVLRKPEERKLLSGHAGFYYRGSQPTRFARLAGGIDLKVWQQTDFRPGVKAAVGLELGKAASPLTFLLEGYTGFRPYSQYESQHVRWLGIGCYFNPF